MRCACIDIGSNTTRLLVAERDPARAGGLRALTAERVFTAIGAGAGDDGTLPTAKIAEVVDVVTAQVASARRHGTDQIRAVATAAVRRAPNRAALIGALARAGVELDVLTGEEEAHLAFAGALASLPTPPAGTVAVVDVGGGSTEVVVGRAGAGPVWWASLPVGSSSLTGSCVRHDPPSPACLDALAAAVREAFAAVSPPPAELALAVGGSATSLIALAGADPCSRGASLWADLSNGATAALDDRSLERALAALTATSVAETALRLGLHPERVRVLPAGIALLARASLVFVGRLEIARGGLREGVVLELLG
jgi:exopolyphosphatase/guanosine-5'-triphosphate,3'-diphosphate pyrophosphatase